MPQPVYDVIIVGGGPAGSYAAYELASLNHRVAVLEQKRAAGVDVCCTGIISTECFHSLRASPNVILAEIRSARFYSPSRKCLRVQTEEVPAVVVDRSLLDKEVAARAQSHGAEYFFSTYVFDVAATRNTVIVDAICRHTRERFAARAIILAHGLRPSLPYKLGLSRIKDFLVGAQFEADMEVPDEPEIYFVPQICHGAFAWIVPLGDRRAYVGLLAASHARLHLQSFLPFLCHGRKVKEKTEIRQKAIPIATLPRTYADRVLVIGDAAGQTKPTTGGGIYFGHLGTKAAVKVLDKALRDDNLSAHRLSRYQKEWRSNIGRELLRGRLIRKIYESLDAHQIDAIFDALGSSGVTPRLLKSPDFSFDWHGKLLLTAIRHGLPALLQSKIRELFALEVNS